MTSRNIHELTDSELCLAVSLVAENGIGCWAMHYASDSRSRYCVCIGFHGTDDGFELSWKIGAQPHSASFQCDFDRDFDELSGNAPLLVTKLPDGGYSCPDGYASWGELAGDVKLAARRVFSRCRDAGGGYVCYPQTEAYQCLVNRYCDAKAYRPTGGKTTPGYQKGTKCN